MYMFVAVAFMIKGSGDWSVDGLLRKKKGADSGFKMQEFASGLES
jgi:hypothetical protein